MTDNFIELRLPLRREYISVLRGIVGVIAGTVSFNYAEIVQLRVALSEVFELAIKHVGQRGRESQDKELATRFEVQDDKFAISITCPIDSTNFPDTDEERESEALINNLMDEVEFGVEKRGEVVVRMVKYKSPWDR